MKLVLMADQFDHLKQQAITSYPQECCGLLVGTWQEGRAQVFEITPSPNVTSQSREDSFEIDPGLRIRLQRQARLNGQAIIGHYHSHPDGEPRPSARDIAAAAEPELIWLIMAVDDTQKFRLKAWRIAEGNPEGVEVVMV